MQERRSEPRFLCADLVRVLVAGGGSFFEATATLEDISSSGACLQMDEPIEVGTEVEIVLPSTCLKGVVRYCRFAAIGYDVGVEFPSGALARSGFQPDHLLDVPVKDGRGAA